MLIKNNYLLLKILFLFFLIIIPFSLSDYSDNITPEKITSDLRFYEINTCRISLFEFLIENPNVIYQDHYKIRFNDYSSISCFGQITGIDQIGYTFYISIGTSSILNIFLQTLFWLFIISLIPNKKEYKYEFSTLLTSLVAAVLICFIFYSEQRYYSKVLFEFDLNKNKSYFYIFVYFLFVSIFSYYFIDSRESIIINYIPYTFLIIGVYSGLNIYFLSIPFFIFGLNQIIINKKYRSRITIFNILVLFWSYNAIGSNYYLKPDKIRGLSSSVYNFLSVSSWSFFIAISIFGLCIFIKKRISSFDIIRIRNSFTVVGITILFLGYIGSSMPLFNFLNYYYFGQTKYGTDNQNLFSVNYWGESEAWRGFFPSAETVGEFYAIGVLLYVVSIIRFEKKASLLIYCSVPILLIGLYASNNKAAFISLLFCSILFFNSRSKFNKKTLIIFSSLLIGVLLYFIRLENLIYSFEFSSMKLVNMGISYSFESAESSAIKYLKNLENINFFIKIPILIFGIFSFLINRSELWGLFFSRFNPTTAEFLFGTGPYILTDHYSQIDILETKISTGTPLGFLLPHSSILIILIYFGIVGLALLLLYMLYVLKGGKDANFQIFLICLFILLNLIKSDSILYFSSLSVYLLFYIKLIQARNN